MERKIILQNQEIKYIYKRLRRARNVTITVKPDASVLVTSPYFFPVSFMEKTLRRQAGWILQKVKHHQSSPNFFLNKLGRADYQKYKERARSYIIAKTKEINSFYNFPYRRISIRNQTSVWGSCSRHGNLNFNFKLYFLPGHLAEYIITHEICHLKELNHSKAFWALVAQTVPDYKARIKELKRKHE